MTNKEELIKKLTEVKGVGPAKAEAIYNEGFDTIEELAEASIEDLTKIKGINETVAKSIIEHFTALAEEKPVEKPAEKPVEKPAEKKPAEEIKKPKKVGEKPEGYQVKKKPVLSDEMKKRLALRKKIKDRTPTFLRQEWFRYKRIPLNWRRPKGLTSKMRKNLKYRPKRVKVGFRGPKETRGLHPSGFQEVLVYNVKDLEKIDPNTQAARIGGTVGTKKRMEIQQRAKELDIRILNG